jgi:hypothetical protein
MKNETCSLGNQQKSPKPLNDVQKKVTKGEMVHIITSKSLEKKIIKEIKEGKMPRREFLEYMGKGALALGTGAATGLLGGCKKNPIIPPTPTPVTLNFEVYNHTQGFLTNFTRNTMSGEPVTVKISELGVTGVDDKRIVIRHDNFGNRVASNLTIGETSFYAPGQNKDYDVFLFNNSNNAPYQCMDDKNSSLYLNKRNYVVYRADRDGQTCPEEIWENAIEPLNTILDPDWASFRYGSILRKPAPNDGKGDFSYGFGSEGGWDGAHAGSWITVNWNKNPGKIIGLTSVAIAELFENITRTQNICNASFDYANMGEWREPTKDLITYVFVKDSAQ